MTRQFNVDKKLVWEERKALQFKNELKHMENEYEITIFSKLDNVFKIIII